MISFHKKNQVNNTKFYFSQEFRNKQIRTIYKILQLPTTKENTEFINRLLYNINNELYNFYYPKKPFYIDTKEFLIKLGNKGIVETSNEIINLMKQKEIEEKQKEENKDKNKSLNEVLTRPKFSTLDYSDNDNPDDKLKEIMNERKQFDRTLPNATNPNTPEDVGLVPISTKKSSKETSINNTERQNVLSQNVLPVQIKEVKQEQKEIKQEQQLNNPIKVLTYHNDDFKLSRPNSDIDFRQPIDKSLLMENINEGMEDNNFSSF